MRSTRFALFAAAAILSLFALLTISGCGGGSGSGGKINNSVSSPWHGTLAGVATKPVDDQSNIALDSWIEVYWPDPNLEPPRSFNVRLEKEETPNNWGGVHTRLRSGDSDPTGGDWWLEPVNHFSAYTWYRIVIEANGERAIAMFMTGKDFSRAVASATRSLEASNAKFYQPAGPTKIISEDGVTHTITK